MTRIKFTISSTGKPSLEYSTGDLTTVEDIKVAEDCDKEAWSLYRQNKEKLLAEYRSLANQLR